MTKLCRELMGFVFFLLLASIAMYFYVNALTNQQFKQSENIVIVGIYNQEDSTLIGVDTLRFPEFNNVVYSYSFEGIVTITPVTLTIKED